MANKNSIQIALAARKALKKQGTKINSRFGADGNLNKSRKDYRRVTMKSQSGGQG